MSDSFVYQPHVHTPDGVLTPDLIVDRLLLAAEANPRPLGLNLLTTSHVLDDPSKTGCGSAALVLISGGRGAVATVGSAHWTPGATAAGGILSEQLTPKPIAREGVRLEHLAGSMADVVVASHRWTPSGETPIGRSSLGELADLARLVELWSRSDAPRRTAMFISARHADPDPRMAIGYRVTLSGLPGAPALELTYRVRRLVV